MMVNNPIEYAKLLEDVYAGKEVRCPQCKEEGLEHRFCSEGKEKIGFAQFHCPHCGADAHLSRVKFPQNIKTEEMY